MKTDSAARDLRTRLGPDRVLARGPAYDQARRVWNGAVDHRPTLIVRPGTPAEVQAAVLTARMYYLPVSVRGGGHDWAGRAIRPGGLVIDLTGMRQVAVNAGARIVTVGGGVTARTVIAAAAALSSRLSLVSIQQFHGAAARVHLDATAFGVRQKHFTLEIVAAWEPHDAQGAWHRAWADSLSARLAPHALPGGYPGLLGPDDHDQIAHAYGPNDARLRAAKARYDPYGIFAATPGAQWQDAA